MEALLPWVLSAIAAVVTALTGAVVTLWKMTAKNAHEQIEWRDTKIRNLEKKELESELKIEDLEKRVAELELERTQLEARFLVFQSTHDSSPLPCWMKDREGRVLACNKAYETVFLRPRGYHLEDYLSHTDIDVWPEHIADAFRANDLHVMETGKVFDTTENLVNKQGRDVPVRIIKYPRLIHGVADPIGVAGIAILEDLSGGRFNS